MPGAIAVGRHHPFVRRCRAAAADRGHTTVVLLDGEHLLLDALAAGIHVEGILTDGPRHAIDAAADARGIPVYHAAPAALDSASPVRTPSGIVALATWSPQPADRLFSDASPLVVGLIGVQDPGNVGAIIRSAEALGSTGVLALDGTADPGGWKALRGAMGSTFRIPVGRGTAETALAEARRRGVRVAATVPTGGRRPDANVLTRPLLVLFGGEGTGLSDKIVAAADVRLTVPMAGQATSLNVAVSAGLILWEASRARPGP